jgi:hypothetical protein
MLIKFAESTVLQPTDIRPTDSIVDSDDDIEMRMAKFAQELRVIAPKAKDFLYFTCVMMHAAEASLLDREGGFKKGADGNPLTCSWEKIGNDSVKWVCTDPAVMPYKNNNNDIFPESELKIAHKKWVGRPLCLDHQSQSVDKIRGVIVDTIYDDKRKRVIALCALDKKNYPDLAHKVSSGYATNVSMGTAVGRAICTDCGRVARTEGDFCDHMKSKSCYGEINLDLAPLELSLVVSGADPDAKVKHIIAKDLNQAADSLTDYMERKISTGKVDTAELAKVKEALEQLVSKIGQLVNSSDSDENKAVGPTRSTQEMEEVRTPATDFSPNVPEAIPSYASELQRAILGAQVKIAKLQTDYDKLAHLITSEEKTMGTDKKAYYQGTVEPNAGGTTYTPEPGQEIRMQDKHMHGPAPFPGVGPVDGSYPGVGENDEALKRRLQRLAEQEERKMLREAAVKKVKEELAAKRAAEKQAAEKLGYFQGTEEPKTYPKDKGNEKGRMDDKHMHGAPPFPEVGDVDGLYGDDKAVKEKLLRASLKAKFRKVSAPNGALDKAASRWDVYANDSLILSATVDDITRGHSDHLYDAVATTEFGRSLIGRIKSEGFNQVKASLTKQAQGVPPAPAGAPPGAPPAPPPAPGGAPEAPGAAAPAGPGEEPPLEEPEEAGGDKVETLVADLKDLGDEISEKVSDLEEAMGPVAEEAPELEGVPPAPEGEIEGAAAPGAPPPTVASLQSMRKTLNGMLQAGIVETVRDLQAHGKEIQVTRDLYAAKYASMSPEQRKYLNVLAADAVRDAKETLADSLRLMGAVVKYAHGTAALVKRAADEGSEEKKEKEEDVLEVNDEPTEDLNAVLDANVADVNDVKVETGAGKEVEVSSPGTTLAELQELLGPDAKIAQSKENIDLTTKEGRAMYRTKLAQKGLNWSDMPGKAHDGSKEVPNLDVKPTAEYAKFHVLQDTHDAVMQLANLPPKVRKQAEKIQTLVEAGQLDPSDVDELAKFGVDAEAVKYWKQYWAEAKDAESKDFASKLTQEHAQQKQAEDRQAYQVRVKRAYELAYNMRDKGMIEANQIEDQVGEILKWNDDGFNSIKNVVARQPVIKQASAVPTVGLLHSADVILPAAEPVDQAATDLKGFLDTHFANRKF